MYDLFCESINKVQMHNIIWLILDVHKQFTLK